MPENNEKDQIWENAYKSGIEVGRASLEKLEARIKCLEADKENLQRRMSDMIETIRHFQKSFGFFLHAVVKNTVVDDE
jgi:Arc/MetJ-type ribon-helix-helix transcriptional regulator